MSYRPIVDTWILGRPKVKYYGAYPSGFLSRARDLLGVGDYERVLHVCAGEIKRYPFRGLGPNDMTLDADPLCRPDFCQRVEEAWPSPLPDLYWDAILCDPPYTDEDATKYRVNLPLPSPKAMLKRGFEVLRPGGRIGILHYQWVRPPKEAILVAVITVLMGYDNRARLFSVYAKPSQWEMDRRASGVARAAMGQGAGDSP